MPRPTTKAQLLTAANSQFDKLCNLIETMTKEEQSANFCFEITEKDKEAHWTRDKNLKDVLIHLYEWHQLLIKWIDSNQKSDEITPFLPQPYTWKSYGDMNVSFWEKHQSTSYEDAKDMLLESHRAVITIIESFSDEELFEKAYFKWSGTTSVGSYCVSATCAHYEWAIKKIKRQISAVKSK